MKIKPILFSTPMVQAILNGTKTQTRRIIKKQPFNAKSDIICQLDDFKEGTWGAKFKYFGEERYEITNLFKPLAQIGDILWVRETWSLVPKSAYSKELLFPYTDSSNIIYKASFDRAFSSPWKPSIHMPKIAARIFLKVTGVRIERLQDISEKDAIAEGIKVIEVDEAYFDYEFNGENGSYATARGSFNSLWCKINGKDSWSSNPWVWVYEFERVDKPENF